MVGVRSLSLVDLAWPEVPSALARLHAGMPVGSSAEVAFPPGPLSESWEIVDLGRYGIADVILGAGFEPVEGTVRSAAPGPSRMPNRLRRLRTLPDVIGADMRALVCGLNPSLVSADAGYAYSGATNRFWGAALSAGLVTVARRPLDALVVDRVGFTDLVKRASARSHELDAADYIGGALRVERLVAWMVPRLVIFVGLEGWRAARDRRAAPGWQPRPMAGVPTYVMPSTSGANARTSRAELIAHMTTALD